MARKPTARKTVPLKSSANVLKGPSRATNARAKAPIGAADLIAHRAAQFAKPPVVTSPSNVVHDPTQSLQTFDLIELQKYTHETTYASTASKDFHLFYVGRDDVHNILKYVLSRVSVSLYMNMFGYDDEELNNILMNLAFDPTVTMMVTLDSSQAKGKHEKALLDADRSKNMADFNTHIAIGRSSTGQITHTKGFVADGKVAGEGSTNWSASGEGIAVNGVIGGQGYKAQNNTQSIITDLDTISRFTAELISEHIAAQKHPAPTRAAAKRS